jgi:hypothetical protein
MPAVPPLLELQRSTSRLPTGLLYYYRTLEFAAITVHADGTMQKRCSAVVGDETNTSAVSRFEHLKSNSDVEDKGISN